MLLQRLWQEKFSWDDRVPDEVAKVWLEYRSQLLELNALKIPRKCISSNALDRLEIHGFCDASEKAYGACIYIRSVGKAKTDVTLLCAKTKVAPLKLVTIPRLELCAALLLSHLLSTAVNALEITADSVYMWTDSTIVLCWLKQCPSKLKTFVAHRTTQILEKTKDEQWFHVPTHQNPADLLSRGIAASNLLNSRLWWHGPYWLLLDKTNWPALDLKSMSLIETPELRACTSLTTRCTSDIIKFENFSNFAKLRNTTAYLLRFANNAKKLKDLRLYGPLLCKEIAGAETLLIKIVQEKHFMNELGLLRANKEVSTRSRFLNLSPFLKEGIIRVGGRLKNANIPYDQRHPILLPHDSHIARLILRAEHVRLLHAGPLAMINSVRDKYWIVGVRSMARKIVHECIPCFRVKPRLCQQKMGNLPTARVNPSFPFQRCGVDYAGPFMIKSSFIRNAKTYKAYVAVFICMCTKAIHLELVTALTTEAFLSALRRFSSRRGKPTDVFSDNGTNFVGAQRYLKELYAFLQAKADTIAQSLAQDQIEWHFSPPRAPHFGGLWEAGVKSFKHHLKRVIGDTLLTYEEFTTYLTQIEAILNSRPLCPLSSDPHDLSFLTPAHFLIGRKLTSLPDKTMYDGTDSTRSKFQVIQTMRKGFWKMWSKDYLNELTQRGKWKVGNMTESIEIGDLVLVDAELNVGTWNLGRITDVHPGNDGTIRVVTVETRHGQQRRPIAKIGLMPIKDK